MRDRKRRLEAFSFFDYTGIARHLSRMAEKGWMIESMSNFGWVYRRIDAKKLSFWVSYFPKASEFDPEPTREQQEFHDFCAQTGWVLAARSAQMQVFCNEREDPVPLETDPAVEVQTIRSAARRSYLPVWFTLLLIAALDCGLFVSRLLGDPVGLLASALNLFTGFTWLLLFLLCVLELGGYFVWSRRASRAAERGELPETRSFSRVQKGALALVLLGLAYWLLSTLTQGSSLQRTVAVIMLPVTAGLILLVNGVKELLKRLKVPRGLNRTLTVLTSFVLAFALMGGATFGILRAYRSGLFDGETAEESGGLPLELEELLPGSYEGYRREVRREESLLLGQVTTRQRPRADAAGAGQRPELELTVTEVKLPLLYGFCRDSLLSSHEDELQDGQAVLADHYEPWDPAPWGAREAYRLYWSTGYLNQYLLCYEDRLVEIRFSWEPTEEQIATAAERFAK